MSRTVGILIVSWLCIFSVSDANVGTSCNETVECESTIESCNAAASSCICSSGYFDVGGTCKLSTITVTLSPSSSSVVYGSDAVLTASFTSDVAVRNIVWQKVSDGTAANITTNLDKYIQSGEVGSGSVTLTIKSLVFQDKGSYQVLIINTAGTKTTSNQVSIDVTGGTITVSLSPSSSSVVYGSDAVLTASVTSDVAVGSIKWQKVLDDSTTSNLVIDQTKYIQTGDVVSGSVAMTIKSLVFQDKGSYQVQIINTAGTTQTSNQVSINVTGGELTVSNGGNVSGKFNGSVTIDCTVTGPELNNIHWIKYLNNVAETITIDDSKYTGGSITTKALTINNLNTNDATEYQCQARNPGGTYGSLNRATVTVVYTELAPIITDIDSTTSTFTVFWNHPTSYYNHISEYEVKWKVFGVLQETTQRLNKTMKQHTVSSNLVSGQLYTVYVISNVNFINPPRSISVNSNDTTIRLVPKPPGPININESILTYNNLQLTWDAPINTIITNYEVTLDGLLYVASSNVLTQFSKNFVPGKYYIISIVIVSGTTDNKKSTDYSEWIRIIPTKPGPPTDVLCPQNPLDMSLEISWTAPSEPNGLILRYQINVSPGNPGSQIFTSSNETMKTIESLIPEQLYTFTVQTINDAHDSISDKSQSVACKTKAGVPSAPTNLKIDEIQSRGFRIYFSIPDNVKGILAAYKIVISKRGNCVQQILVYGNCSICESTHGCPQPLNHTVSSINNAAAYTASGLDPYIIYTVRVVAINKQGEGHPVDTTVRTDEEVPQKPGLITANNILSKTLLLSWNLPNPVPGNTTYTIYTYEGSDDKGTTFMIHKFTIVYGFDTKTLLVTGLEEYWPYKFKVNAATVKGNTISDFSSIFRTKQSDPGRVLNLTVQQKRNDYKSAYLSWSPPALRDHNGVLKSYLFSNNHTGTMNEEEIPVLLSEITVVKKLPVMPDAVYVIKVVLQNNESMNSQASMQSYRAPAGPPPVTDIEPVTTKPGEHRPTTNTITVDINTEYFKKGDNGKQVFFGIAVCAKSNCVGIDQNTYKIVWKDLPNWHNAHKKGFPLYRVTNDTFMDDVNKEDSRQKRTIVSVSTIKFIVGEDQTCPSLNENVYCNGPLTAGTSYSVIIFACTNGGCTYSKAERSFATIQQTMVVQNYGPIIGSVVAVTFFLAVTVSGILLWKRNRRHKIEKEYKEQANTYADLNLEECTIVDQPYSLLEHGSRNVKSKSVPLNSFFDYVVDLLRNNRQKLTKEYHDLLQNTERAASTVASSKNNTSKNRGNIIPYDFNRVKLCLPGANDYIDASVLLDKFYILTSFPFAKTFGSFWQMIWEQNVSTIVVITGQSNDRESWYFSDNEGTLRTIEKFDVELLAKFNSTESVTMRKIKLSRGRHSKVVNHFHVISLEMTDLPDQILALINTITQNNVNNTGPQVVHGGCTGVDNSGVYIAVDHAVKSVGSGGYEIDVYGTARTVMKERMFSISSLEQYSAIYTCLQKYVQNSPACKNDATGAYEYLP